MSKLTKVTIDFETYWDRDYSLSKMSFIEYIKSPLFEVISCSVKVGAGQSVVYWGKEAIAEAFADIDWGNAMCIAHNGNEFDFPLLVWVFDVHPRLFVDTLCLSRPKHQSEVGGSLKALSEIYGLPAKDNTALLETMGKRLKDFDELRDVVAMTKYNAGDSDNSYELLNIFSAPPDAEDLKEVVRAMQSFKRELLLSDMTARMICYPKFDCDIDLLQRTLDETVDRKREQLESVMDHAGAIDAETTKAALMSNAKFAAVLQALGVTPPTKISKKTGKETYAFAKSDEGLLALQEHDNEVVQNIVAARLGTKSTLLETRLQKMATCALLMDGKMPVPLAYHSATTGRWGGRIWNPQNLPRIPRNKDGSIKPQATNALRLALRAPDGHKVVVSDLSGIELRVNHYLWDVASTQKLYEEDPEADLYKEFAATLFGVPKEQVTKEQRQLAKVAQLGLGFGAGWSTFKTVAKSMGGIVLDDDEAKRVTNAWRVKYGDIVMGWTLCGQLIQNMYLGTEFSPEHRGLISSRKDSVILPSGRRLYYPELRKVIDPETGKAQFKYGVGRKVSKVYGGLMDENLVQAIARDVISEQAIAIHKVTGYRPVHMVHDELVYVVPEDEAESHLDAVNKVMRTAPTWLPGIVLWSEGDIADSYGEAK